MKMIKQLKEYIIQYQNSAPFRLSQTHHYISKPIVIDWIRNCFIYCAIVIKSVLILSWLIFQGKFNGRIAIFIYSFWDMDKQ